VHIGEETDARRAGRDLAGDLHLLCRQSGDVGFDPCDIASRPRFARDQAEMDGISQRRTDDGNLFRRRACRNRRIDGSRDDHGGLERNDLLRKPGKAVLKSLGISGHKRDVPAIDIAEAPHPIQKIVCKGLCDRGGGSGQPADARPVPCRALRPCLDRPCDARAAHPEKEFSSGDVDCHRAPNWMASLPAEHYHHGARAPTVLYRHRSRHRFCTRRTSSGLTCNHFVAYYLNHG
jgi:hypothetical protein